MTTCKKLRAQKHRAKMKASGFVRLEVTIGNGMVVRAREIGRMAGWPLWRVIEEALEAFVIPSNATGNRT